MVIDPKYEIGELVYLQTCPDQYQRLVIAYIVTGSGEVQYQLALGEMITEHFEFELSKEKTFIND